MLNGKTVLIAGGSSGIGLAVARLVAENGARVVIASRHAAESTSRLTDALGPAAEIYALDVTSDESVQRLLQSVGAIDHLVIAVRPDSQGVSFLETPLDSAKSVFETKVWGACRLIRATHPHVRASGSITLTSGIAGEKTYPGALAMALANSAVETLCRSLAVELAPVRVNAVSPGFVAPKPRDVQDYAAARFPAKRLATAREIAAAYLYLMTSLYATGTVVNVDGGARLI